MNSLTKLSLAGAVIAAVILSPIMFVQAAPTVSVEKINPASVNSGNTFTYTLTVRNAGDTNADNVILRDTLDGNLTFVSSTPAPSSNTTTITDQTDLMWNLGTITAGGSAAVSVTVRAPSSFSASTSLTNSATASGSNFSTVISNTSSILIVQPNPSMSVVKRPDVVAVNPGETYTYEVIVTNVGGSTANDVVIHEIGGAGITLVSAVPAATMNADGTMTWNIGALASGSSFSATVTARINADATIGTFAENRIQVSGSNFTSVTAPSVNTIIGPAGTTPLPTATPTPDIGVGGAGPEADEDELPRTGVSVLYAVLMLSAIIAFSLWLKRIAISQR